MRNQHIFPKESIKRFADQNGNITVNTLSNSYLKKATNKKLFAVRSHWEVDSEIYQGSVETPFQELADKLINNTGYALSNFDQTIISNFYALWHARSFVMDLNPSPINIFPPNLTLNSDFRSPYFYDSTRNIYPIKLQKGVLQPQNRVSFSLHSTFKNACEILKSAKWQMITADPSNLFAIPKDARIKVTYIPLTPELALHGNKELEPSNEMAYSIFLSKKARTAAEFITRPAK